MRRAKALYSGGCESHPVCTHRTGNPRGLDWVDGVAERLVVPKMPSNVGRGKEPQAGCGKKIACGSGLAYNPVMRAENSERITGKSEGVELEWFDDVEA